MPRMPKPQPNPDYYSTSSIISRGSSTTNIKLKILENELREDLAPKNMVLLPNLNKQLNLDSDSLSFYIFDASDPNEKTRLKRLAITSLNKSIENKTEVAIETQNILNYKFVDKLPTIETAKSNTIYFVKDTEDRAGYIHDVDKNFYNEYLFVKESKTFEKLGGASLDLTAYRTAADQDLENIKLKNEIVAMFERVCQYKGTVLNVTDLPTGAKVGDIYKVINEAFSKNICAGDFMIKLDTGWDRLSSTIDSDLSVASINAVQNRIVTKALNKLADTKQDKLKEGKNDTFLHRNKETNELEWILGDNSGITEYAELAKLPTINGKTIIGNKTAEDYNLATITELNKKQDNLISGTNIKTVDNFNILGDGNIYTYSTYEFENKKAFPAEGIPNKLYIDLENKLIYRWDKENFIYDLVGGGQAATEQEIWDILKQWDSFEDRPVFLDFIDTDGTNYVDLGVVNPKLLDINVTFQTLGERTPWASLFGCRMTAESIIPNSEWWQETNKREEFYTAVYIGSNADKLYLCCNQEAPVEVYPDFNLKHTVHITPTALQLDGSSVQVINSKECLYEEYPYSKELSYDPEHFYLGTSCEFTIYPDTWGGSHEYRLIGHTPNTQAVACRFYQIIMNGKRYNPAYYKGVFGFYGQDDYKWCPLKKFKL